jgi:alanine racemase
VTLRAVAEINLAAIERNVARLRAALRPPTELCAVVKADGYGHGAVPVARAALAGGATALAVVSALEAQALCDAGIDARVIVLGALSAEELPIALGTGAELIAWDQRFLDAVHGEVTRTGLRAGPVKLHVKLDTGMGRLGTRSVDEALAIARRVVEDPMVRLAGAMTHFAKADSDQELVEHQLAAFVPFVEQVRRLTPDPITVHAANSAATLRTPASHFDMVRCGIATYGCDPMNDDPEPHGLEAALALRSYVAAVKPAAAGESCGYGRQFIADRDTHIATVPIGYGDGLRRGLTNNCDVLIGGRRYPLVGTVSMDNITVDVGRHADVSVGDLATLIGTDGPERQTAEQLAARLQTINYEITCGLSARVSRRYHRDGEPAA